MAFESQGEQLQQLLHTGYVSVSGKEFPECCRNDSPVERHRRSEIIDKRTMTMTAGTFFTRLQRPQRLQLQQPKQSKCRMFHVIRINISLMR